MRFGRRRKAATNTSGDGPGRKRFVLLLPLAVLALLAFAIVASAGPVGDDAGFEDDDGNLVVNSTFDWNGFAPTTWTGTAPTRIATDSASGWDFNGFEDWAATTQDSGFAGGTKQDDACPTVITQKADNKADLERYYLATKEVNGDDFLELAWIRIPQNTTSPSAHVAFELNKSVTKCTGSNIVTRSAGDMLIVYDFEGGSTDTPTLRLERWVTSGSCEISSHKPPCWGPATDLTSALGCPGNGFTEPCAEGKVNTTDEALDEVADPDDTLEPSEFGEAGINLDDAGVTTDVGCGGFASTFAVSRTSGNSGTAQMKDLVGPGTLSNDCGAIKVTKTRKHAAAGSGDKPHAGVSFTVNGVTKQTDSNGVACFDNLPFGTYTVHETVPAGYNVDANDKSVTADNAASCSDATYVGETVSFHNTPLTNITVSVNSQVDGGTGSTIDCDAAADPPFDATIPATSPDNGDGSFTLSNKEPGTYTCTIIVDP